MGGPVLNRPTAMRPLCVKEPIGMRHRGPVAAVSLPTILSDNQVLVNRLGLRPAGKPLPLCPGRDRGPATPAGRRGGIQSGARFAEQAPLKNLAMLRRRRALHLGEIDRHVQQVGDGVGRRCAPQRAGPADDEGVGAAHVEPRRGEHQHRRIPSRSRSNSPRSAR